MIRDRLREAFDTMVARQEQSPSLRQATQRPGFSVPGHIARSPSGFRRVGVAGSTQPSAVVSSSVGASSSVLPSVAGSITASSLVAEGDQSESVADVSVVSEPVRPHVRRLPADHQNSVSQPSLFSRVAYKTARGRSRRLIYRRLDTDDENETSD